MVLQIDFKTGKPVYLQLVDQIRYAAASVDQIIRRVRMSRRTFYEHFRDLKHALYEAFFCEGEDIATDVQIARAAFRAELDSDGAVAAAYDPERFRRIAVIRADAEAAGVKGVPSLLAADGSSHWGMGGLDRLRRGDPLVPRSA